MSTETELVPISRWRGRYIDFLGLTRYLSGPGRIYRFEADTELLDQLERRKGTLPTLRDVPASAVTAIVEDIEERRYPLWQLTGSASESIFDRLDAHWKAERLRYQAEMDARQPAA